MRVTFIQMSYSHSSAVFKKPSVIRRSQHFQLGCLCCLEEPVLRPNQNILVLIVTLDYVKQFLTPKLIVIGFVWIFFRLS